MLNPAESHALIENVHSGAALRLPLRPGATMPSHEAYVAEWQGYLRILYGARRLIGVVTGLCLFGALIYALAAPPVYEAQMLIYVEEDSQNASASKNILNDMSALFETKKAAIAEMELLRSRRVLTRAVDAAHSYIQAAPRYFPLTGFRIASAAGRGLSTPGLFGHGGYVWGDERIVVAQFEVPDAMLERAFVLEALGGGRYRLRDGDGVVLPGGVVGADSAAQTPQGRVLLRIDQLHARAGAQFLLRRISRLRAVQQLQDTLVITEQGKQSGVIEVKLQDGDAGRVNAVLTALGDEYMRQNQARKREAVAQTLASLDQQLPVLKAQLEQAESAYNRFRERHDSVNLAEEVRLGLQRAAELKTVRSALVQKRVDLLSRFTDAHPVLLAVDQQLLETARESDALAAQIKTWPQMEEEEGRLTRGVKVRADLYLALLDTAQQLRVWSAGGIGNVRLVDASVAPERPVRPNRLLVVALAGVSGLFLGCMLAFIRKVLHGGIDEPGQIETVLGVRAVYAAIPHSRAQDRLRRRARTTAPPLAQAAPGDAAIETLRAFRAALEFALPHNGNNIVALAGPTRGVGAAFVSLNLAVLLASGGKRTLLIDADLRAGRLHAGLGLAAGPGLADALCGAMQAEQVVRRAVRDKLDVIAAGAASTAAADFLQHLNFGSLLATLRGNYDVVLIVTPPVLAVADALVIGTHAGALFLVARAGLTTQSELSESIKRLNQAGIAPHGIVFNDAPPARGRAAAASAQGGRGLVRI